MAKIYIDKNNQARITIPSEVIELKEWSEKTEILVSPLLQHPNEKLDKTTPILIKEIKGNNK